MDYEKINWKNQPNKQTPINATNLNHMDDGIYEAHERINANSIISTATGEAILVTDSAKVPPENIKLFGKTTQVNTEGNQLLKNPENFVGVQYVRSGLGSDILLPLAGTYTMTFSLKDASKNGFWCGFYDADGKLIKSCTNDTRQKSGSIEFTEDEKNVVTRLIISLNESMVGETVDYAIFNYGSDELPFEPYTGGQPSPSIDYPQELNSCGDDGSIENKLLTLQLLKTLASKTETKNGVTCTIDSNGNIDLSGTSTGYTSFVLGNINYLQAGQYYNNTWGTSPNVFFQTTGGFSLGNTSSDNRNTSFDVTDGNKNVMLYLVIMRANVNCNSMKPKLMISVAPVNMYEPYTEQTLTALTPNGLPGLPLGQTILDEIKNSPIHMSGVYHDGEQYWIGDTKEYKRGKNVHRILKVVLDGSTAYGFNNGGIWHLSSSSIQTISGGEIMSFADLHGYKNPSLSNYFITQSDSYGGVANEWEEYYNTMCVTGSGGSIAINAGMFPTPDDDGFKAFFTEHPTEIYAIAKEPIETDLTSEELAQYKTLCMNYPNTTITNDSGAYMDVEYVASPKEYIANLEKKHDNDIQQLKTAIIALGGTI